MTARAIIDTMPIILVFSAPGGVLGFIGLWGKVLPALFRGLKFPITYRHFAGCTPTVLVSVRFGDQLMVTGLVAQSVKEVSNIKAYQVEATPGLGHHIPTEMHPMKAKDGNRVRNLTDINQVIDSEKR